MGGEEILTLVTVAVPIIFTGWWRWRIVKTKASMAAKVQERRELFMARREEEKIKAELRDELREDNQKLREEIEGLKVECGNLRRWILRLENLLRSRAPDAFDELLKTYERPA